MYIGSAFNIIGHVVTYVHESTTVEPLYGGHHRGMKFWPLAIHCI